MENGVMKMKRLWIGCLVATIAIILIACSDKDENLGFDFDENGENIVTMKLPSDELTNTITLEADGDKVHTQTTENEASYDHYGVSSKASAEVAFNDVIAQYRKVEGLTYDVEFLEEGVHETLSVDFDEVDIDALKEVPGIQFDGNIKKGISLKATVNQLEEAGYVIN